MSKKFAILQNPTFKHKVDIPRVGGDPLGVEFEFKYLTRPQLSKLQDDWNKSLQEMLDSWKEKDMNESSIPLEYLTECEIQLNIQQIKDIVVGWGFSEDFDEDNIRLLVETTLGTTEAVIKSYLQAYEKAKLGN